MSKIPEESVNTLKTMQLSTKCKENDMRKYKSKYKKVEIKIRKFIVLHSAVFEVIPFKSDEKHTR